MEAEAAKGPTSPRPVLVVEAAVEEEEEAVAEVVELLQELLTVHLVMFRSLAEEGVEEAGVHHFLL